MTANLVDSTGVDDSTRVDRFEPEMNRLDGDKDTDFQYLLMPRRLLS